MSEESPYKMTLSLNVLEHLGLNLYSNIPAVLSEVVANSWDADAENVAIKIDKDDGKIVIVDDGHGMTLEDINGKYLTVGYRRRAHPDEAITPKHKRKVMGRKGIGKLSLFSIAKVIEVHTVKADRKRGFKMTLDEVRKAITEGSGTYVPLPIDDKADDLKCGTRLVLMDLKKEIHHTEGPLRKRLARRFSVIGKENLFSVEINRAPIGISDRDYFHKVQYLWRYGEDSEKYKSLCSKAEYDEDRDAVLPGQPYKVSGWIGTVAESGDLKDKEGEDNLNKIVVLIRGKLAQEDILEGFPEGGLYSKYLIGEICADFLDEDDKDDIATTSRQKIIEDDPRYQALRSFIYVELKHIQNKWTDLRNTEGAKKALEIPQIKEWFDSLGKDHKRKAESLFGRINRLTVDAPDEKRRLFKYGVLAFESLKYKENLDALERLSIEKLEEFAEVFAGLDDMEASLYYQIVRDRIEVIKKLQEKVEENVLEKVIQKHLFDHLWLLDPTWERGTTTPLMEKQVTEELGKIDAGLSKDEKASRLDIKYKTTSGKHVIIELKRADRTVNTNDLSKQIGKYRNALQKILNTVKRGSEQVEFVCVVGREPSDWKDEGGKERSHKILEADNARIVFYQELIENAYKGYQRFIEKSEDAGKIYKLIQSIDTGEIFGEPVAAGSKTTT